MSSSESLSVNHLQPGDIIELTNITELPLFEDLVAADIDPTMTNTQKAGWAGRMAIKDLLRPPRFNGRITNIQLSVMKEPYEKLGNARERGWRFSSKGGQPQASKNPTERADDNSVPYRGFGFTADARSTGRGIVGQIQAELWYRAVASYWREGTGHYTRKRTGERIEYPAMLCSRSLEIHGRSPIQRIVTQSQIEAERFIALDETARKIGFRVLQQNMRHPIVQPITQ